jgi:hypothetical protein
MVIESEKGDGCLFSFVGAVAELGQVCVGFWAIWRNCPEMVGNSLIRQHFIHLHRAHKVPALYAEDLA